MSTNAFCMRKFGVMMRYPTESIIKSSTKIMLVKKITTTTTWHCSIDSTRTVAIESDD